MTETVQEWKERFLKEQEEKKAKEMDDFVQQQKANALKEVTRVESFTLPDGGYYVGCPSLVLPEEPESLWTEFYEKYESGLYERDGHKFIVIPTGGDGYYRLYDTNEDGAGEDPETGEPVEGPIHIDSLPTDVATLSIIPFELLETLGCDMDSINEHGYVFELVPEGEFQVEFKYKMYEGFDRELLSHVDFLWFKLNLACQYMEKDDED